MEPLEVSSKFLSPLTTIHKITYISKDLKSSTNDEYIEK